MIELVCWSCVATFSNVLDWYTTNSAMRGLPPEERVEHEMNPLLDHVVHRAGLVLLCKLLFGGIATAACVHAYLDGDLSGLRGLRFLSVVLLLAVGNNVYAKWAAGHGKRTPGLFVMDTLRIENKSLTYLLFVGLFMGIAYVICLVAP